MDAHIGGSLPPPSIRPRRSFSSLAALLVKVIASTSQGRAGSTAQRYSTRACCAESGTLAYCSRKRYLILADGNRYLLGITATTIPQQIGNPVNQHGRLTGASARQQKQRPLRGQHALALAVVQILIIHSIASRRALIKRFPDPS